MRLVLSTPVSLASSLSSQYYKMQINPAGGLLLALHFPVLHQQGSNELEKVPDLEGRGTGRQVQA